MTGAATLTPRVAAIGRAVDVRRRRRRVLAAAASLALGIVLLAASRRAEVDIGALVDGMGRLGLYLGRTMPSLSVTSLASDLADWYWGLTGWLLLLGETTLMAVAATVAAGAAALLLGIAAAAGLAPRAVVLAARRLADLARTVPEAVTALVLINAFGLGLFAGAAAIALHATGVLAKQFADVIEAADPTPAQAMRAVGANWPQLVRFGVIPTVMPDLLSLLLLRFEINLRSAGALGLIGAGGIGGEIAFVIRQFVWTDISALLLMMAVAVAALDVGSERLRMRLILPPSAPRARRGRGALLVSRLLLAGGVGVACAALWMAAPHASRLWEGIGRLAWLPALMWPPSSGGRLAEHLSALVETASIALVGTAIAILLAVPVAVAGARGTGLPAPARAVLRRSIDLVRAIDALVWALVFVSAVGLGPFAGVLAIALTDAAALGKLYAEAIEAADRRQVEAAVAAGADPVLAARFALVPQVLPVWTSLGLYTLESNCRNATILGVVGAGGIGVQLYDSIRLGQWPEVGFLILLILGLVTAIDVMSGAIRRRLA